MLNWLTQCNKAIENNKKNDEALEGAKEQSTLSGDFRSDVEFFRALFDRSSDVVFRELLICGVYNGLLIFIDGLVDGTRNDQEVISPLLNGKAQLEEGMPFDAEVETVQAAIQRKEISACQTSLEEKLDKITDLIASGDTALFLEGSTEAIMISMRQW